VHRCSGSPLLRIARCGAANPPRRQYRNVEMEHSHASHRCFCCHCALSSPGMGHTATRRAVRRRFPHSTTRPASGACAPKRASSRPWTSGQKRTPTIGHQTPLYHAFVTTALVTLDPPVTLTLHYGPLSDIAGLAVEAIPLDATARCGCAMTAETQEGPLRVLVCRGPEEKNATARGVGQ
jgi:hypothetical protein